MVVVLGITGYMFVELLKAYYQELKREREIESTSRIEDIVRKVIAKQKE